MGGRAGLGNSGGGLCTVDAGKEIGGGAWLRVAVAGENPQEPRIGASCRMSFELAAKKREALRC